MRDTYGLSMWVCISVRETLASDMDFPGAAPAAGHGSGPAGGLWKISLDSVREFCYICNIKLQKVMTEKSTHVCAAQRAGVW